VLQKLVFTIEARLGQLQEAIKSDETEEAAKQTYKTVADELSELLSFYKERVRFEENKHKHA